MSTNKVDVKVNQYLEKAQEAGAIFSQMDQQAVDKIVHHVCQAGFNARVKLAKMAVEETKIGIWKDKVIKNIVATQLVYRSIKDEKTVGIIDVNDQTGITQIAQPLGPVLAVTPITSPTSTVLFKILLCLKSRNPIIISPHVQSVKCCKEAARICYETALEAGAPDHCIQFIEEPSIELASKIMQHPNLRLILATGDSNHVKAAHSSSTPALGISSGNVPVLIEDTADIPFAVKNILFSKTFDNGTMRASEQAIVVKKSMDAEVRKEFKKQGAIFLHPYESENLEKAVLNPETGLMKSEIVGQPTEKLLELANIPAPKDARVLIAPLNGIGKGFPLSREILAPVLAYYTYTTFEEGIKLCIDLNHEGGLGHTVSIYSNNESAIAEFSKSMDAGRVLVNTPSSQGAIGGIFNMLKPSLTLGCGAGGRNITMQNITARHLINIKSICHRRDNQRFLQVPVEKYLNDTLDFKALEILFNENT
jgi:acetaldehyde dehydrogenase/alcohol dehydrogenase